MSRLRRVPRAGWLCALVAVLNGVAWSLLVPAFHVPDENSHVAYVQYLAETGKLPTKNQGSGPFSPEEERTLVALDFYRVIGRPRNRPPWSALESRQLRQAERHPDGRVGDGNASTATNNPPLYHALAAIPYWISPSHDLLDRLQLMRLLSALLAGLTVLAVFGFLRELLPGTPWAWTVGALAVAFQPLFGFMSGGVNNDDLLYVGAAATFYALARAFRRGLDPAGGALLGAALAVGILAKLNLLGFLPGVGLALAALVWRAEPGRRRLALQGAAVTVAVVAAPMLIYLGLNTLVWDRYGLRGEGGGGGVVAVDVTFQPGGGLRGELAYIWQLFLPRLPFMNDQVGGQPFWDVWANGFLGRFGWLDYGFTKTFYDVCHWILTAIAALAVVQLVVRRDALRRRWPELLAYAACMLGLLLVVGVAAYPARSGLANTFVQPRYLLPLLALYAAILALAARAGGRRLGPAIGALLVVLAVGHSVAAQLLTISRFYG